MSVIGCECGRCKLTVKEQRPVLSLLCACEDCRKAIQWGAARGGKEPRMLPKLFYVRSDITGTEGDISMKPYQLRTGAKSTRVYCTECYSILGVDHPAYNNNVFMFFDGHCKTNLDLSEEPTAAINMDSYPGEELPKLPPGLPVINNHQANTDDLERFLALPKRIAAFADSTTPLIGRTFREFVGSLGEIKVLNLEIGAAPI